MKKAMKFLLLLVLLPGLVFTGCSSDNNEQSGEPTEAVQELVVAIGAEPENLDPITMMSSPAATIAEHMAQTLIYLDVDGTLQPSLAESWEPAEDGKSWYLYLRKGVEFHDGTPFNAEAVKYNLDRFIGLKDPDKAAVYAFLATG